MRSGRRWKTGAISISDFSTLKPRYLLRDSRPEQGSRSERRVCFTVLIDDCDAVVVMRAHRTVPQGGVLCVGGVCAVAAQVRQHSADLWNRSLAPIAPRAKKEEARTVPYIQGPSKTSAAKGEKAKWKPV